MENLQPGTPIEYRFPGLEDHPIYGEVTTVYKYSSGVIWSIEFIVTANWKYPGYNSLTVGSLFTTEYANRLRIAKQYDPKQQPYDDGDI